MKGYACIPASAAHFINANRTRELKAQIINHSTKHMWIHIGLTLRPPYSTGNRSPLATVQMNRLAESRFGHSDIRTGNWTPAIQRVASQSLDSIYCRHGSLNSLFSVTQCLDWLLSNEHRAKATEALSW